MSLNLPASTQVPTIGRKVWFWVSPEDTDEFVIQDEKQALDATVVYVHPDGTVTLDVTDHSAFNEKAMNVPLFDYDPAVTHGMEYAEKSFATWMPYQMQKHKEEATKVAISPARSVPVDLTLTDGKDV